MVTEITETRRKDRTTLTLIDLPPLPAVAVKVLRLLSNSDIGMKELGECIRSDPAFSSELLTLANSALFGFRAEIKTVLQAIVLLGSQRVKALALVIGMKGYLADARRMPVLLASWRHSLACALIAEELATAAMADKDFAYLAGLLHDVGRLALGVKKPREYAQLLSSGLENQLEVMARERELFGFDHCEAGRLLARSWKLPPAFAEAAFHHHVPKSGKRFGVREIVSTSCAFADTLGFASALTLHVPTFQQILAELPDWERKRFDADEETLAGRIAIKINSLDS
jgi:putative nucleotidyltransferase with HDIG domain